MTKIAVVGSRKFTDYPYFCRELDSILADFDVECLVSGGAEGADQFAERYARERGLEVVVFPAAWDEFGRRAGPLRNRQIVEYADVVVAFWDGKSSWTRMTIATAQDAGKPVLVRLFARVPGEEQ